MGIGDWIVLSLLAVWAAAALRYSFRAKRGCHGCGDCGKCGRPCKKEKDGRQ